MKASQLAPHDAARRPALVEVDTELSEARRRGGAGLLWLRPAEAVGVVAALGAADTLAAVTNFRPAR